MGVYQYSKFLFISFIKLLLIFLMAEVTSNAKQRPWATSWLQVGQWMFSIGLGVRTLLITYILINTSSKSLNLLYLFLWWGHAFFFLCICSRTVTFHVKAIWSIHTFINCLYFSYTDIQISRWADFRQWAAVWHQLRLSLTCLKQACFAKLQGSLYI